MSEFRTDLVISVRADGLAIGNEHLEVGSGCAKSGIGLAVPRSPNAPYDYAGLRRCLTRIRADAFSNGAFELTSTSTAEPSTPYETIMKVIDAVAKTDDGDDLIPDLDLALAPRRWHVVTSSTDDDHARASGGRLTVGAR